MCMDGGFLSTWCVSTNYIQDPIQLYPAQSTCQYLYDHHLVSSNMVMKCNEKGLLVLSHDNDK